MKLLPPHVDETQARYRLLGPKRDRPATRAERHAQGEVSERRDGFQAAASNAGDERGTARMEPPP
jgi:hypothetical protein